MARKSTGESSEGFGEIVKTIVYALIIALVFRVLLFQPFSIPSSSMKPTLLIGDYLFVSKYAYGYSKHSIPFSPPLFEGRVWFTPPKRGDVIVFKNRKDDNKDYIKRLIGLPGDKIQVQGETRVVRFVPCDKSATELWYASKSNLLRSYRTMSHT